MSWTDKQAVRVINYLRKKYKVKFLVETGTFKGINARLHSKNFKQVFTCEKIEEYYNSTINNLKGIKNVYTFMMNSKEFLKDIETKEKLIFYLDAHFYDPKLPKDKRFVVLDELKEMKRFKDSIIIIHDFDNNLGHITYDGINLDMKLLKPSLLKINKNYNFYTNTIEGCDPVKVTEEDIKDAGLVVDFDTVNNLMRAWEEPRLTYRGLLYCLPKKLNKKELKELGLREICQKE